MGKSNLELQAENIFLKEELIKLTKKQLREDLLLEQVITNISTRFVNLQPNCFQQETDRALAEVGSAAGIDRAYVFLYNYRHQELNNTNEWCARGIDKEIDNLKNIPINLYPWWNGQLSRNEDINLYSIDDLPPEAVKEREILSAQSILSLLAVPVFHSGELLGFIGFDSVRKQKKWTNREVRILRLLAEIFGSALNKIAIGQKLTDSLEKYRLLVENSTAAILIADCNGTYYFANTIAGRNVNMAAEDIIGKSVYDFFPKKQAELLVANTKKTIKYKKRTEHERLVRIGNRQRWLKTIVEPLSSDEAEEKVMVISYDIHEEKTKNLKIEELNHRLVHLNEQINRQNHNLEKIVEQRTQEIDRIAGFNNSIINTTGSIIFFVDNEGIILTMNPVAEKILGYQYSEVVNRKRISDLYSPSAFKILQKKIEHEKRLIFRTAGDTLNYIANNLDEPVEFTLVAKDGTHVPVMMSINSILDKSGQIIQYAAVAIDIRKRIEAEKALQLQQIAFENFAHALVISDIDGKLIWCNASYEKLSGYSFEELRKEKVGRLEKSGIHPEKFYQELWNTILEGNVWRGEVINKRKDGSIFPEDLTISPLKNSMGEIINFVAIKIDISEKKKAEQELKESNSIKQGLLDTFPDLLFHLDKTGTYKDAYSLNKKKLYLPREQFLGKRIKDVMGPGLAKLSMRALRKALSTRETVFYTYSLTIKNVKNYFENRIVAISEDEVLSIVRDITDTKLAEIYGKHQRNLGFKLASVTSPEEAVRKVIKYILKTEEISAVGFFLYKTETNSFYLVDYSGISDTSAAAIKEIKQEVSPDQLIKHSKLKIKAIKDVIIENSILQKENFAQIGYKPIIYGKRLIGILAFGSPSGEKFNDILLNHLGLIASQMSGALHRIYTQQQLISSRENFRMLFDTIDEFVFILDTGGNLIEFNTVVEKKLGHSGDELYGMNVLELHPPDRREEAGLIIEDMLTGKRNYCSIPLYTKEGDIIPAETKVVRGKWNGNDAVFGLSRDISQRLKYEDQLRKSEARWQFALESSGDGIWDWNFNSDEVFYSAHWKKMLGYREDEISDTADEWEKRVHPDDFEKVMGDLNLHLEGNSELFRNEHRLLCKNGEYKWILGRGKVISRDKKGAPERMIGTSIDISARKNIENSLALALQKEKELNELKSQFVSMASHEFRTPLATMMMAAEGLDINWDKMTGAERKLKIGRLKNNIVFLRDIIEKTLNLSRLESGKIKFSPTRENLNLLVMQVIQKVSESFHNSHQINFKGVPVTAVLAIDKQMIEQVISNLLTNSFKYSDPGTIIDVIIEDTGKGFIVEITDRGVGIPKEAHENIFDAFRRGPNVRNIHGTGLGLAISKNFTEMHGGNITFHSEVNKGTTFTVFLPRKR